MHGSESVHNNLKNDSHLRDVLLDSLPCIALILKKHSREIVACNAYARRLGAVVGKTCFETLTGTGAPCPSCKAPDSWESGGQYRVEAEHLGRFWEGIWQSYNDDLYVHYIFDITERKQAEMALRESEERLRLAVAGGGVGLWEWNIARNELEWNEQCKGIFGFPVDMEGLTLENFMATVHRDDIAATEQAARIALEKHAEYHHEYRIIWPDNSVHWVMAIGRGVYDTGGNPVRMLGCALDITDRKRAEEALRENEAFLKASQSVAMVGSYSYDVPERIWTSTETLDSIFGIPASYRKDMEGWLAIVHPDDRKDMSDYLIYEVLGKKSPFDKEYRINRIEDRMVRWVHGLGSLVFDAQGNPVKMIGTIQDVTERRRLEDQLRQAQKMEAIGHLAGGVAHDFNNILSAIVGYAHIVLMKMKDDDPLRIHLEQILASSERAGNLTKSLLAFSRKQVIEMRSVNINDIVRGMTKILERIIGEDIYLRINTTVHTLIVSADKNQIEQVLMNLTTNARDAMPRGGTLTVATEECKVDEAYIQSHRVGGVGHYAVLSVADTGAGMDDMTMEKMYDPFFTTKEVGKGTGLGLAMTYGTIKQHGGFITVSSEPGKGTTFRIHLPLKGDWKESAHYREAAAIPTGAETILLVEDDESVRNATKSLLQQFGYTVMDAVDGKQALTLFWENKGSIQLVVTDIIMPGRSGRDLYNELREITPDVKVLFMSGYSEDLIAERGLGGGEINFLLKPAYPETLLNKIREILDE